MHSQLPENTSALARSRISVLHVDDDDYQLEVVKQFVEQLDDCILVKPEHSAIRALRELDHGKFDCVVLDFIMPEMNGLELARRIREKHGVPVILYTGQGSEEVAEEAFTIGVDDYIRKELSPSHYQVLAKRIRYAVEKRRIEVLYRKSEQRYKSLVNLAPDGIVILNTRGIVTFANPSMLKLTGHTEGEIVGKWFPKMGTLRLSDMPRFLKIFADIVRGRVPPPTEFAYVRKDGSEGWGEAHISLLKRPGEKTEVLAVLREVTERRRLIEELENKSRYLETQVEERTRKLLDSERMVAAGTIAAQLGHDLRGPLNTIRNAIYLMEHNSEVSGRMIAIINKALDAATQMLDEIRVNRQEVSLNLQDVDLDDFIASVLDESVIPEVVRVDRRLESHVRVSIDAVKMRRVVSNLLLNALDAMKGGGRLRVSTSANSANAVIRVRDNGSGIPDHIKANLFKPFVTSKVNGTGLGLSFCKQMVEAHVGTISIESKVGAGTLCTITLPLIGGKSWTPAESRDSDELAELIRVPEKSVIRPDV